MYNDTIGINRAKRDTMEPQTDIRFTLRLPAALHMWLLAWAAGDKRRPPASLNSTILYVLEVGKNTLTQQDEEVICSTRKQ